MKKFLLILFTSTLSSLSFVTSAQTGKIDTSIVEIYLTDATPLKGTTAVGGEIGAVPVAIQAKIKEVVFEEVPADADKKDSEEVSSNEVEVRFFNGGQPSIKGYFEKSLTDTWALYLSVFQTRGWTEFTTGPVYYLTPEMSVGVGVGQSRYMSADEETKSSHSTVSAFWYFKSENWEAEVLAERYRNDKTDPTYFEGHVQRKVTDDLSVGFYAQNDIGWGPRIHYSINKSLSIWFSPIVNRWEGSDVKAIVGVSISF